MWVYCCVCLRRKGTGGLGRALALDNLVNLEFVVVETASSEPTKGSEFRGLGLKALDFKHTRRSTGTLYIYIHMYL